MRLFVSSWRLLLVLVAVENAVSGNSVHFTNSEKHLAKSKYEEFTSYHLDVPGSADSITIIESKDKDKNAARDMQSSESKRQLVYAPGLLSKYIEEYNRKKNDDFGEDPESHQIEQSHEEEYRSYGRPQHNHNQQMKNPFRENEGWVTLEAVPWSKSKVSIWKAQKPGHGSENHSLENESVASYGLTSHITHKHPQKGYLPPKAHTYLSRYPDEHIREKDGIITAPPIDRFYEYGSNDRSDTVYSHSFGYPGEVMNKEYQSPPYKHRPPAVGVYRDHHLPSTYPENGNGEWVLVSSTKGYQKNRQPTKKSDILPKDHHQKSPISYRMHKALKLTVLPPKDKSTKMVLSHNGLIEVAESTKSSDLENSLESAVTAATKKKKRQVGKQEIQIVKAVPVNVHKNVYDQSTVLAAVTAGIVPAGMAMMVPLLGKK